MKNNNDRMIFLQIFYSKYNKPRTPFIKPNRIESENKTFDFLLYLIYLFVQFEILK